MKTPSEFHWAFFYCEQPITIFKCGANLINDVGRQFSLPEAINIPNQVLTWDEKPC